MLAALLLLLLAPARAQESASFEAADFNALVHSAHSLRRSAAAPYRIYEQRRGIPADGPAAVRVPVVFLVPRLAGPLSGVVPSIAREIKDFDSVFAACGIGMDVKLIASFDTAVPLTPELGARLVVRGPVDDPESHPLSPGQDESSDDFFDSYAATLGLAARRYSSIGVAVVYLEPLVEGSKDHFGYSDAQDDPRGDLIVIGSAKGQSPALRRKIVAHELGHIMFRESHPDGPGNLMSTGAQELISPSDAITPTQCGKARAYIRSRWP